MSTQHETGTSHFLDRFALTRRFEENLEALLEDYGIKVATFGQTALLKGNTWISSHLRRIETKKSLVALMIKFSPDYIGVNEKGESSIFFFDAKASITPVFYQSQIERIRVHGRRIKLTRSHIGEIEREAWFSYNTFYPKDEIAIIISCPYSTRLILAEWVKNIRCLWCFKGVVRGYPVSWDCKKCPVKTGEGFGVIVNEEAAGSGTPHTNIDFTSMRTLPEFLHQEFGVQLNLKEYNLTMLEYVKQWPLSKPKGKITWKQYNGAIRELRDEGCDWLKYKMYDKYFDSYEEFAKYWSLNRVKDQ